MRIHQEKHTRKLAAIKPQPEMSYIHPSIGILRILAGEGNYNLYKLLSTGRRWFIFAKCALTTYSYLTGESNFNTSCSSVALVKGENQRRLVRHLRSDLVDEFGCITELSTGNKLSGIASFPKISIKEAATQFYALLLMLLTGKRRYLNIYLLQFRAAMKRVVNDTDLSQINTIICFNDQPYDIAAIIEAFNEHDYARTIVVQHGLILNEKFYFPTVTKEFRAWGTLSNEFFKSWKKNSQLIITGRYREDCVKKAENPVVPEDLSHSKILLAPSFHHGEVKELIQQSISKLPETVKLSIKLHPATKMKRLLVLWCKKAAPRIDFEHASMEDSAELYDALITKNSTSAIDFLLRGKPVAFLEPRIESQFPSADYGISISDLGKPKEVHRILAKKNAHRLEFLKRSLNV